MDSLIQDSQSIAIVPHFEAPRVLVQILILEQAPKFLVQILEQAPLVAALKPKFQMMAPQLESL